MPFVKTNKINEKFFISNPGHIKKMMLEIAPVFKGEVTGGFVRLERLGQRQGDNAEVARLTWTKEVVVKTEPVGGKPTKKEQKVSKVTQAK
jgi:hypothetical protein